MLDNTPNQPSETKTKHWVEKNDDSHGTHNSTNQTKFKTSMLKLILCNYIDAYILVSGTKIITRGPDNATDRNERSDEKK